MLLRCLKVAETKSKIFKRVTKAQAQPLQRDEEVGLQDRQSKLWNIKAWVRGARPHGRSYLLETEYGSLFLRNRKFIKQVRQQPDIDPSAEVVGQELNHSLPHATSGRSQTLRSADQTGEQLAQPQQHGGAVGRISTDRKAKQLVGRATGGSQTRSGSQRQEQEGGSQEPGARSQEQEQRSYAEVTRGVLTRGRARNLGLQL